MAITKNELDTALTSTKNKVSYNNVDAAAKDIQNTIDNVTTTKVGEKAGEIVGGIESVTSKTDVLGQVNKLPTEGLVTSSALSGSINDALNTNIDNLSSDIGVSVSNHILIVVRWQAFLLRQKMTHHSHQFSVGSLGWVLSRDIHKI